MRKPRSYALPIAFLVIALLTAPLSLKFLPVPCAWLGLAWSGSLFWATWTDARTSRRAIWFNAGVFFLVVAALEGWLSTQTPAPCKPEGSEQDFFRGHSVLGYAAQPSSTTEWRKHCGGKLVYDVTYTIDADGLRVSAPRHATESSESLLFFGGSFTFGEGVQDHETMPYVVGQKTGKRYKVYNFGFSGYGAHHMAAATEHGIVKSIVKENPKHIIYQAIVDHIRRAAGWQTWSRDHPKYVLKQNGQCEHTGSFRKGWEPFFAGISSNLRKSFVLQRLLGSKGRITRRPLTVYVAIVERARNLLRGLYPDCRFHTILWDVDEPTWVIDELLEEFAERGIEVHRISEILPDIAEAEPTRYRIGRREMHPGPRAHERIADYVARELVSK